MLETFYATSAQICFALLGLWWVVVQFKYDLFLRDAARRRTAYNISLYFVLPGAMSLFSLLAAEVSILWQLAFIVAGVLGIVETAMLLRANALANQSAFARGARYAALLIYVLIVIFALAPGVLRAIGITPLLVEGVLLALIVFLGVQFAWTFFMESREA
ncbi:MAG: hypothetical protein HY741_21360 [Chloroflexi bacterium]|nr:hypothetical protein [Chloroflexota bacterium]